MANKPHPLDDPPTASSSEDDELETSSEEGSSSEEDEQAPVKTPSAAAVPVKPTVDASEQQDESDSETGSETETDSDSETELANPPKSGSGKAVTVTTVVSPKPKQKEAQTSSTTLASPAVKSGMKRASEAGTSRDTKRGKTVTSGDDDKKTGDDAKKDRRLWLEEDEIAVLQGMIDFKSNTGKSPYEDTNGFYEFIRKSISFEVSKNQFMDKIRSLRKKYMGKEMDGPKTSFTKPHELKCFELSKTIWGPQGIALESAVKSNGVSKKSTTKKKLDTVRQELVFTSSPNGKNVKEVEKKVDVVHGSGGDLDWFENSFIVRAICGFGMDERSVKQRWKLVPEEKKNRFEERLKALQAMEIDFVLEKTELMHEVTSMIVEAAKNSSN